MHLCDHLWEHACKLSLCVSCAHVLCVNYSACLLAAPLLSHVTSTMQLLLDNAFTHSIITSAADIRTAGLSLDYEMQMLQWTGIVWNSMSPWTLNCCHYKNIFYFPCYQTLLYNFMFYTYNLKNVCLMTIFHFISEPWKCGHSYVNFPMVLQIMIHLFAFTSHKCSGWTWECWVVTIRLSA